MEFIIINTIYSSSSPFFHTHNFKKRYSSEDFIRSRRFFSMFDKFPGFFWTMIVDQCTLAHQVGTGIKGKKRAFNIFSLYSGFLLSHFRCLFKYTEIKRKKKYYNLQLNVKSPINKFYIDYAIQLKNVIMITSNSPVALITLSSICSLYCHTIQSYVHVNIWTRYGLWNHRVDTTVLQQILLPANRYKQLLESSQLLISRL